MPNPVPNHRMQRNLWSSLLHPVIVLLGSALLHVPLLHVPLMSLAQKARVLKPHQSLKNLSQRLRVKK